MGLDSLFVMEDLIQTLYDTICLGGQLTHLMHSTKWISVDRVNNTGDGLERSHDLDVYGNETMHLDSHTTCQELERVFQGKGVTWYSIVVTVQSPSTAYPIAGQRWHVIILITAINPAKDMRVPWWMTTHLANSHVRNDTAWYSFTCDRMMERLTSGKPYGELAYS